MARDIGHDVEGGDRGVGEGRRHAQMDGGAASKQRLGLGGGAARIVFAGLADRDEIDIGHTGPRQGGRPRM